MENAAIDILIITYNRPEYTRLSLPRLLETCDERMRVWIWHNGDDEATLEVVRQYADHPRVAHFHHSRENVRLREPTHWLWHHATGEFFTKVDDDCLMPDGWADTLRRAHHDNPRFGAIGCWRFPPDDFVPELAQEKIKTFSGDHQLLLNCWVEGSGYLMKRECFEQQGDIQANESFNRYCIRLARRGWINGWYYPFLYQEHMDDPRSPNTLLKSDADIQRHLPLSAHKRGFTTVAQWEDWIRQDAHFIQQAPLDPRYYIGLRPKLRRVGRLVQRVLRR